MRSEAPEVEISEIEAARLDRGKLVEITGPSLFSSRRAAVIYELENLAPELESDLVNLATEQLPDLAIITRARRRAERQRATREAEVRWRRGHRMCGCRSRGSCRSSSQRK